jgi:hypothetical protein
VTCVCPRVAQTTRTMRITGRSVRVVSRD